MAEVNFLGQSVNLTQRSEYSDTILTPVFSSNGPVELTKVVSNYSGIFNNFEKNISDDTAKCLSTNGYSILGKRIIPWNSETYANIEVNDDYKISDYDPRFVYSYEFDGSMKDGAYIAIGGAFDYLIWVDTKGLTEIPVSLNYKEKEKITQSNLDAQLRQVKILLEQKGFKVSINDNILTLSSYFQYRIKIGRCFEEIHHSGIRFFNCPPSNTNKDLCIATGSGIVTSSTSEVVTILYDGNSNTTSYSNPSPSTYDTIVSEGQLVNEGDFLFYNFNYSYPEYGKEYDLKGNDEVLNMDYLQQNNLTYSIKIKLQDRDTPVADGSYIILNYGTYNLMIWYIDPILISDKNDEIDGSLVIYKVDHDEGSDQYTIYFSEVNKINIEKSKFSDDIEVGDILLSSNNKVCTIKSISDYYVLLSIDGDVLKVEPYSISKFKIDVSDPSVMYYYYGSFFNIPVGSWSNRIVPDERSIYNSVSVPVEKNYIYYSPYSNNTPKVYNFYKIEGNALVPVTMNRLPNPGSGEVSSALVGYYINGESPLVLCKGPSYNDWNWNIPEDHNDTIAYYKLRVEDGKTIFKIINLIYVYKSINDLETYASAVGTIINSEDIQVGKGIKYRGILYKIVKVESTKVTLEQATSVATYKEIAGHTADLDNYFKVNAALLGGNPVAVSGEITEFDGIRTQINTYPVNFYDSRHAYQCSNSNSLFYEAIRMNPSNPYELDGNIYIRLKITDGYRRLDYDESDITKSKICYISGLRIRSVYSIQNLDPTRIVVLNLDTTNNYAMMNSALFIRDPRVDRESFFITDYSTISFAVNRLDANFNFYQINSSEINTSYLNSAEMSSARGNLVRINNPVVGSPTNNMLLSGIEGEEITSLTLHAEGKNICDYYSWTKVGLGAITIEELEDGRLKLNGTGPFTIKFHRSIPKQFRNKTLTYSIGGLDKFSTGDSKIIVEGDTNDLIDQSGAVKTMIDAPLGGKITFKYADTATESYLNLVISSDVVLIDVIITPQLEFGDEVTEFEPYRSNTTSIPLPSAHPFIYSDGVFSDSISIVDGECTLTANFRKEGSTFQRLESKESYKYGVDLPKLVVSCNNNLYIESNIDSEISFSIDYYALNIDDCYIYDLDTGMIFELVDDVLRTSSIVSNTFSFSQLGDYKITNDQYKLDDSGLKIQLYYGGVEFLKLNPTLTQNSILLTPELPTDVLNVPKILYINTRNEVGLSDPIVAYNQRQTLIQTLSALGFNVTYNEKENSLYLINYQSMRITDISNVFSVSPWDNGNYDAICNFNTNYKLLDIRTKYSSNVGDIVVKFNHSGSHSRIISGPFDYLQSNLGVNQSCVLGSHLNSNYSNYSDYYYTLRYNQNKYYIVEKFYEYELLIDQIRSDGYTINSEVFEVDLDINSPVFIDNVLSIKSNLIESTLYKNGFIKPGTYKFSRNEDYNPDDTDVLINMLNIDTSDYSFEVFIDSGIISRQNQKLILNKYRSEHDRHFLSLFNISESEYDSLDYNGMLSTKCAAFSYPHFILDDVEYPGYVAFLINSIKSGSYSDEAKIDKLVSSPSSLVTSNLMSIYYDKYRYVLTHNFIDSDIGKVVPEVILILARIENYIYNNINYTDPESIVDRFIELSNEVRSISGNVLNDIYLDDISIKNKVCKLDVIIKVEVFRADPINLRSVLSVSI